jgi:Predicted membrane protein
VVGIFKANNPFNTFLLFLYGLLLKLTWFIHPHIPIVQKTDGFLFRELLIKLENTGSHFPVIYPAITYLLLFTQAVTFNKLINDQKMMQRPNYLPGMSYLLITSMFSEWNILTAPLVINTLLIWVWARMSTLYSSTKPKSTLFNIGMMIGVSTFFYFPSLAFVLLIVFALIVSRPFILAEWIISILGIVTPYYFLFSYLFLTDKLNGYRLPQFEISHPMFHQNYWEFVGIGLIILTFLIGLYFVQANFRKQLVQVRKRWSLLLLYLIVAVFVPFINATHTFEYWILTAIPLSAYVASGFLYPVKRWLPIVLHLLMIAIVFVTCYGLK